MQCFLCERTDAGSCSSRAKAYRVLSTVLDRIASRMTCLFDLMIKSPCLTRSLQLETRQKWSPRWHRFLSPSQRDCRRRWPFSSQKLRTVLSTNCRSSVVIPPLYTTHRWRTQIDN
ncbi:hypothetical protein SCLCIDRAFT_386165 [Scleroderma citrinum Foug A]|uniref:Uncharacterized protein n=1 Tax=Scleroderma citrinum Foug A TaxID=1036808 RepID=A0A0C3DE03_9AGAM|nr:hypothetical protein SCLCIDRAFT_386165 [Scleroderma citrinum Foug A]